MYVLCAAEWSFRAILYRFVHRRTSRFGSRFGSKRIFKNMVELFSQKSARKSSEIKRFQSFLWQAAPIKISTVFLVFSMVSAFLARFLELAASYCWLLLCNQKRYCGIYGILCGLHDSVNDLHFDGFPALCGSGHKSACSAQHG